MGNTSIFPQIYDHYTEMTFRPVAYAGNCYKDDPRPEKCSLFHVPKLPFRKVHNATCPFSEGMCLQGQTSAYELTTGFLDAKLLGINEKYKCQFWIRKVCSPLRTNEPYILSKPIGNTGDRHVEYYYGDGWGTVHKGNLTLIQVVSDPAAYLKGQPHYSIIKPTREWRPEVRVKDSKVTLYFIQPINLVYTAPSPDPIFPATV
ncbi:hypothetical protein K458DRAFT_330947, partial [Lentithecium fluviatile CBS 122367]